MYAEAAVPEYWILEIKARRVRVYRDPRDGDFAVAFAREAGETVSAPFWPERNLSVADLFPDQV